MQYKFLIDADYRQIYIEDSGFPIGAEVVWTDEDIGSWTLSAENGFIVQTARAMTVPVYIDVCDVEPALNIEEWDHINLVSLRVRSGLINVFGTTDYSGDYRKIPVSNGVWGAYLCYKDLGSISEDGLEGEDNYHIYLWKTSTLIQKEVVKNYDN